MGEGTRAILDQQAIAEMQLLQGLVSIGRAILRLREGTGAVLEKDSIQLTIYTTMH